MKLFEGKSLRQRRAIGGSIAAATAGAVILTSALVPIGASAAPGDHSEARAQFLSGSILTGINLDSIAGLAGTEAINTGAGTVTDTTDLDLTALSLLNVTIPNGASIPLGDLLALGAVNQFSQAQDAGISRAASGAVSDAGIVDTSGTGEFPASASLDLMALLPSTPLLTEANLTLSGVTGVAALDAAQAAPAVACADLSAPVNCRGYNIAGATTNLELPAVGAIATTTQSSLGTLSTTLNGLSDEIVGGLLGGVTGALDAISDLLPGVSLVSNNLNVTVNANLAAALDPVLAQDITVSGVTINAAAGTVTVDWENILGLNGLAPNTPLISPATLNTVATNAAAALAQLQTEVNTALAAVTDSVNVQISGGVCLLQVLGSCTAGLNLSFNGSLADLLDGSAPLGVSGTGLASVLTPILGTLTGTIQTATAAVVLPLVTGALNTAGSAITTVVGAAGTALSDVFTLLGGVVGVTVNVQEDDGAGTFTEVAARLSLLGGSAVSIDLGRAEVGPNAAAAAADPTVDAHDPVQAGTNLSVTGADWVPGSTVTLTIRNSSNTVIGTPVTVTVEPDGTFPGGTVYLIPTGTTAGTDYVLTATDDEDPQNTATDTVSITAGGGGDVNTNAAASASASADATADGDPSAQAAAEAAAFSDATSIASAAATADAEAAAVAAATVTASSQASTTADADVNASAAVAAQAAAQADASDDVNAAASTAAEANSSASSEAAATTTSSADASNEASANTNATASATASANADASTAAVAEAAAQAAAYSDSDSDASAAADIDASAAAETAATATSSTTATADATSAANAGAAIAAQAAALADATSNTAADTSATSDASTSAASNALAAAIADASTDASTQAVASATSSATATADPSATSTATAAADPDATASTTATAEVNTNASASAAASAQADADNNAVAIAAAQAAALADATSVASADADSEANIAAQAAATATASADASTTATSEANAAAAASAQAAAQTDATSISEADATASADADPNAAAAVAANATSSNNASATAAADATASATASATSTATASATANASANANPTGKLGITVKVPVLERGQQQTAVGTGFKPGEVVTGVMNSDPLALGTQVANAEGTVTFTWAIPAGTDLGTHTVTLTGAESGSVAGTFQVVAKGLATTGGTAPNGWIVLGALLLMFGLGTALVARSKRETIAAE